MVRRRLMMTGRACTRARLEAGLTIEARQEIVRLLVGQIVIHGETSSDGARSTRAVVEYRFPGAVQTDTGTGSSPRQAGSRPVERTRDRRALLR